MPKALVRESSPLSDGWLRDYFPPSTDWSSNSLFRCGVRLLDFTVSHSRRTHSSRDSLRYLGGRRSLPGYTVSLHILHFSPSGSLKSTQKASQILTSLLPEYAVTDPRTDYIDGWLFMPREKKTCQELGRFPHASPLSRQLIHTRFRLPLECYWSYIPCFSHFFLM